MQRNTTKAAAASPRMALRPVPFLQSFQLRQLTTKMLLDQLSGTTLKRSMQCLEST